MSPDGPQTTSPEEKLLKLIRGTGSSPAGGGPPSAAPSGTTLALSTAKSVGRRGQRWSLPPWWLTAVNVGIGALLCVELIGLVMVATQSQPVIEIPIPQPASGASHGTSVDPSASVEATPEMPSLNTVASRPLFQAPAAQPGQTPSSKPSEEIKKLAARLTLLGIVAGDPAQAIIEDAETRKTFFVSVGQSVVDGLVVTEVRENRVVLELDGEHIELSL